MKAFIPFWDGGAQGADEATDALPGTGVEGPAEPLVTKILMLLWLKSKFNEIKIWPFGHLTHPCLAALNIVKVCSFQYSYSVPVDDTQAHTELRSCKLLQFCMGSKWCENAFEHFFHLKTHTGSRIFESYNDYFERTYSLNKWEQQVLIWIAVSKILWKLTRMMYIGW